MCVKCNKTPVQLSKRHAGCCVKCSPAAKLAIVRKMCVKCNKTPMQSNKKHAGCYAKCSPFVGVKHLIPDTVATVVVLVQLALKFIKEFGLKVYAGLLGSSGQSEINQDEKCLKEAKLIDKKLY